MGQTAGDDVKALGKGDPARIGAYRILGVLGEGGMGRVYLGRSEGGRTVALKVVRSEIAQAPDFRRRFAREVDAARRVAGPWTAAVLDADVEAAVPWVATQYIAGPDLHTVVAQDFAPLPERSVRFLACRLALALQGIHGGGLIHRDLKPSNILVTVDGPRVIDFGIARALDGLDTMAAESAMTRTGMVIGSPGFMSPEQARGRELTPASDVFCLGSVLVYAATGRQPFGAGGNGGLAAQLFSVAEDEPDLSGVPSSLVDLVRECLAKDPRQRPTPGQIAERAEDGSTEHWLPSAVLAQLARRTAELLDYDPAPAVSAASQDHPATVHVPEPSSPPFPTMPARPPAGPPPSAPVRRRSRTAIAAGAVAVIAAVGGLVALEPWADGSGGSDGTAGKGESAGGLTPATVPDKFTGTWEGQLTQKGPMRSNRVVRVEILPGDTKISVQTVDSDRFCMVEADPVKVKKEFYDRLVLGSPKLRTGAPATEKDACAGQPIGSLVAEGAENSEVTTLSWEFGNHAVTLFKKPKMAVQQKVPTAFTGHWQLKKDDSGFSPDRRLQLQTVTIDPGNVLLTSKVAVSIKAGKPGEATSCFYQGGVFSISGEKKDILFTTNLESGSPPDGSACPASLPAQMYLTTPDKKHLSMMTMGSQGVAAGFSDLRRTTPTYS
ncbi:MULTISPECIES: serine/threonine-protein kinase [Streptomyces]|uniref:serine/threonine-protein kinase n=1 Tax=Streptomyces TaxID=1883 RepID=UPI001E61B73E|nr:MULTISPECIES: serine/threonine-protein kinase [Streptomyces]UFQ18963.1 serine/threonine protein kinase [Streptomyces huasconensis]WCL88582.1 serine/threonine-protein kinase [Streptomyces sp. JCM 35825]